MKQKIEKHKILTTLLVHFQNPIENHRSKCFPSVCKMSFPTAAYCKEHRVLILNFMHNIYLIFINLKLSMYDTSSIKDTRCP